jgi:hypothetical protein
MYCITLPNIFSANNIAVVVTAEAGQDEDNSLTQQSTGKIVQSDATWS